MKTTLLTKLHERAVLELSLLKEAQLQKFSIDQTIVKEDRKKNGITYSNFAYLLKSRQAYINDINRLESIEQRLKTWYYQTLNKIMYHTN